MTVSAGPAIDLGPILGALDPEQRAAALLRDGPAQIIAPAGSGKTTTMVARLAVLLSRAWRRSGSAWSPSTADLRLRWQSRFAHVWVDEFQDVDAAQLRLVRLLAAPEDNLFVVGDDDQP